ncbi:MAG: hypothetical protein ACTHMD_09605 [Flavisolibacter sp.]
MNEENVNYLKENLKYMGFGDQLYSNLEHNIGQGFPEFVLRMETQFGSSKLESALYFSRSKQDGRYFFNRHDARLKNEVGVLSQSFLVNKGHGVTLKEAFNLLQGRAVHKEMNPKEGERYHAWLQLDFNQKEENGNFRLRQFHEQYGYDLAGVLAKFPIRELSDETKAERLMMSLQKGNLQPVTMMVHGKVQKLSIQADPQFKTLTIYDNGATKPLNNEQKAELVIAENRQKLNGKEVPLEGEQNGKQLKQNTGSDKQTSETQNTLLPKNRKGNNKGLTVH